MEGAAETRCLRGRRRKRTAADAAAPCVPAWPVWPMAPSLTHPAAQPAADFGVEEAVRVEGLSKADVAKQLEALVKKGEGMPRSSESEGAL